jgi:hypothetical protein
MASENIGELFPTKIPGYDDAADIQAALRLYHYGSSTYDETNTDTGELVRDSIAGQFNDIDSRINAIEDSGFGSEASSTEPATPLDGYIWMDLDSEATITSSSVAAYQNSAPTTNLVDGALWVDKDSSPLKIFVYDSGTSAWREIGV